MLGMIISQASFDFQGPGLKVKVTGYFQKKFCHCSSTLFIDGFFYNNTQMLDMIVSRASSSFRMLDSVGCSLKNLLTVTVILKILSLPQHLHLQIDLWEGICIACDILFKDHMCACQQSDTGPPGPLVKNLLLKLMVTEFLCFYSISNGSSTMLKKFEILENLV